MRVCSNQVLNFNINSNFVKVLRLGGAKDATLVYCESFTCVSHLSVSGKLLYPFVDLFLVQWSDLLLKYKRAKYVGRLQQQQQQSPSATDNNNSDKDGVRKGYVLVTVGSTMFEELIKAVDSIEIIQWFQKHGYSGLHIQFGNGKYQPTVIPQYLRVNTNIAATNEPLLERKSKSSFDFQCFRFVDSLAGEIRGASLVIGHAGTGSILETLCQGKVMIAVPNQSLMNDHQTELAKTLHTLHYLFCTTLPQQKLLDQQQQENTSASSYALLNSLEEMNDNLSRLKLFPAEESALFATFLNNQMNLVS